MVVEHDGGLAAMTSIPQPPAFLEVAAVLHALADPVRLAIVQVSESDTAIACRGFDIPAAKNTLSRHLKILREAGISPLTGKPTSPPADTMTEAKAIVGRERSGGGGRGLRPWPRQCLRRVHPGLLAACGTSIKPGLPGPISVSLVTRLGTCPVSGRRGHCETARL
jgi:hypothetical protein